MFTDSKSRSEMVNITISIGPNPDCQSAKCGRAPRVGLRGGPSVSHSTIDRFWARVQKNPSGCWLFAGAVCNRAGHVLLAREDGTRIYAHRYSYELHHGPIPSDLVVRHRCDVGRCVNPDHLLTGTQKQNVHDAIQRNRRNAWGRQRLTEESVLDIRERFALGEPQKSIAASLGVSKGCIHAVVHRQTWAHLPEVDRVHTPTVSAQIAHTVGEA